jgi:hypothetical protein
VPTGMRAHPSPGPPPLRRRRAPLLDNYSPQTVGIYRLRPNPNPNHIRPPGLQVTSIVPHHKCSCLEMAGLRLQRRLQIRRFLPLRDS